jgi:hypothetical protein
MGGLSSGAILFLLSSSIAYGYNGIQLILMTLLPALGWIIITLNLLGTVSFSNNQINKSAWKISNQTIAIGILVGLVTATPLSLLDADELVLVLNSTPGEILSNALQALLLSIIIQFGFCFFLVANFVVRHKKNSSAPFPEKPQKISLVLLAISVLLSISIAGFIHFAKGQPGFYGEHLFVVLKNQADISSIPKSDKYQDHRQQVFNTLVKNATSSQKEIIRSLDRFGISYTQYYLVNAIEVPNNPIIRIWLTLHPEVDRILPSPRLRPLPKDLPVDEGRYDSIPESNWNIAMIGADQVWSDFGVIGDGIIIGQSDSGVQADHPELVNSYRGKIEGNDYNWYDPWNQTLSPVDLGGHGTHTLGTIVGENVGVAPGANWFACVNLARNLANPALYLDCMQFMLAPFPLNGDPLTQGDPSKGAHIINNSWGCPEIEGCDPLVFQPAVSALREAGVFVVASAGNDGPKCETLNYPLPIYDEVFSVGAVDRSENLASFSSIGPVIADGSNRIKPDIVAPGVSILSSTPGSTYGSYSGTSMAGPHVAGVVALMWSANPSLIGNIDLTEEIIINSAKPYQGTLPNCPGVEEIPSNAFGFGIVNAYDAVKAAIEYTP